MNLMIEIFTMPNYTLQYVPPGQLEQDTNMMTSSQWGVDERCVCAGKVFKDNPQGTLWGACG